MSRLIPLVAVTLFAAVGATAHVALAAPNAPATVYVGSIGTDGAPWTDRLHEPRRLIPCSADANCQVIGTTWRHWGTARASGRGVARVNDCQPDCADGHFHTFRGAGVLAYRLRDGD